MNEMYYSETKSGCLKHSDALEPAISHTARTFLHQITQQLQSVWSWNFSLDYYMIIAGSVCKDTWHFMYTFICRNSPASSARNALQSIESSTTSSHTNLQVHCAIRTTYCEYTALSVQHTRTKKKHFTCLISYIWCKRRSDLPSKYAKALSLGWWVWGCVFTQLL